MSMFGKLSQKVLNVATPAGAGAGVVGTNSIDAYQEYAQGMQALNLFELPKARAHFNRALALDSTFALAHAKLAVLLGWIAAGDPAIRQHAEAAGRLSGSLPPRERALIDASLAFTRGEYVRSCDGFRALIRKDSTDTDAWYGLGDCLYHDNALEPIDGDSTRVRWRANRNESLRAFRQVLALDPTYHLAYQHIVDAYSTQLLSRSFCVTGVCTQYVAVVRPGGDSLLTVPLATPRDSVLLREHLDQYIRRGARRDLLTQGKDIAERWVAANPSEGRARLMYATALASLGSIAAADTNLRRAIITDSSNAGVNALFRRMEITVKLWRGADASRLYDSIRAHPEPLPNTGGRMMTGGIVAAVGTVFGRLGDFDSLMTANLRQANIPPVRQRISSEAVRAYVGVPTDSFPHALAAFYEDVKGSAGSVAATKTIGQLAYLIVRRPTSTWPAIDTTVRDVRVAPLVAILRKDTVALRGAARGLDSLSSVYLRALLPDTGITLYAADAFLVLGDSLRALQMTRRLMDSIIVHSPMLVGRADGTLVHALPNAMLLRADLAAGLGFNAEARLWYDRFLGFWGSADPVLQPIVERARRSRAAVRP
jgi:tetratricopeptide (TPR) repeat protein